MNAQAKIIEAEDGALVAIQPATALSVLTDQEKFDAFYIRVKAETDTLVPDTSTEKGRKAIAAMAFKVVKTKTAIDAAGKTLTEDWRKQTATVDASRKSIRDKLDALRDEVRKPLTDWEAAEEQRGRDVEAALKAIEHAATVWPDDTAEAVATRITDLEAMELSAKLFEENLPLATSARHHAIITLQSMQARLVQEEADRLELARLREAAAERDRLAAAEREEQARAEAAAVAARIEKEAQERRQADEAARVQREADARDRAAADAAAAAQAETERKAREAQEERDAAHRAELARVQRESDEREAKATADQRARDAAAQLLADEQAAQRRADEARAADRAHRGEIMGAAKDAIIELGITEAKAKALVLAIAAGSVPNVSIRF